MILATRESIYQYKGGGKVLIEIRNEKTRSRGKDMNNIADQIQTGIKKSEIIYSAL